MPRIVAGQAKGRRLAVPADGTRPTSDRAREALFNSLRSLVEIEGVRVLDLFAGTGAVGLEALSRGAREAVFVEADPGAVQVLRANIDAVQCPGATIARRRVAAFLDGPPPAPIGVGVDFGVEVGGVGAGPGFELVFADPPYNLDDDALTAVLTALDAGGWLAEDAVLVVERSARSAAPHWPEGVEGLRDRRYGAGVLWYGRRR